MPDILVASARLADAEVSLCLAIETWHASHGLARYRARRDLRTAILDARQARGALAQARRQQKLDRENAAPMRLCVAA